jgi:hypothetical protein
MCHERSLVSGRVADVGGVPISGALIELGPYSEVIADSDGHFQGANSGGVYLFVSKEGFRHYSEHMEPGRYKVDVVLTGADSVAPSHACWKRLNRDGGVEEKICYP